MDKAFIFGLSAGVIAIIAYGFYFKQLLKSESTPNPASWAIWLLAGLINTFTYFSITNQNIWQSLIVIVVLFSTLVIFLYSLWKGKFTKVSKVEVTIFVSALLVGIFWQTTANYRVANILLQLIYLLSYIPTIIGIFSAKAKENPTSWTIILFGYVFSTLSICFGPHSDWVSFLNPVVNGLLGTGLVVFAIVYKKFDRKKFE